MSQKIDRYSRKKKPPKGILVGEHFCQGTGIMNDSILTNLKSWLLDHGSGSKELIISLLIRGLTNIASANLSCPFLAWTVLYMSKQGITIIN